MDLACFKFATTTTYDVERSFSLFRTTPTDNRQTFELKNLSEIMAAVQRCNSAVLNNSMPSAST